MDQWSNNLPVGWMGTPNSLGFFHCNSPGPTWLAIHHGSWTLYWATQIVDIHMFADQHIYIYIFIYLVYFKQKKNTFIFTQTTHGKNPQPFAVSFKGSASRGVSFFARFAVAVAATVRPRGSTVSSFLPLPVEPLEPPVPLGQRLGGGENGLLHYSNFVDQLQKPIVLGLHFRYFRKPCGVKWNHRKNDEEMKPKIWWELVAVRLQSEWCFRKFSGSHQPGLTFSPTKDGKTKHLKWTSCNTQLGRHWKTLSLMICQNLAVNGNHRIVGSMVLSRFWTTLW